MEQFSSDVDCFSLTPNELMARVASGDLLAREVASKRGRAAALAQLFYEEEAYTLSELYCSAIVKGAMHELSDVFAAGFSGNTTLRV